MGNTYKVGDTHSLNTRHIIKTAAHHAQGEREGCRAGKEAKKNWQTNNTELSSLWMVLAGTDECNTQDR